MRRHHIRYRLRCAALAAGVKPSRHVAYGWNEIQVNKVGWKVRKINQAKGTHPKRRWRSRVQAAVG